MEEIIWFLHFFHTDTTLLLYPREQVYFQIFCALFFPVC